MYNTEYFLVVKTAAHTCVANTSFMRCFFTPFSGRVFVEQDVVTVVNTKNSVYRISLAEFRADAFLFGRRDSRFLLKNLRFSSFSSGVFGFKQTDLKFRAAF